MRTILIVIVLLAVGLVGGYFYLNSGSPTAQDPALVFAVGDDHVTLDPQKISWLADGRIAQGLYETLVVHDPVTLELEPALAESWEVSDDGLTYTFTLRPNAMWSSGDRVTAHHFVYAWRRAMLPDTAADYTKLMFTIQGAKAFYDARNQMLEDYAAGDEQTVERAEHVWFETERLFHDTVGLKAVDDHTLRVTLEQPTPFFLELCAFVTFSPVHEESLVHEAILDTASARRTEDTTYFSDPTRVVTNGPYRLTQRRFKRDLTLEANPYYHSPKKIMMKRIVERIIPDPNTALLAFERGEVHWLPSVPSGSQLAADLVKANRADVHAIPMAGVYFYNFNCNPTLNDGSPNPVADVRVRVALSMAIDRQLIVDQVTKLNQPTTKTYVPAGAVNGYEPPVEAGIDTDLEAARKLLAEAGYPGGEGLKGLSILYNAGFGHEHIAQAIARIWEQELGVKVALEGIEVKAFSQRLKSHDYTVARASWFGDYQDPTTWLAKMRTGDGNNDCGYSNPAFDALLDKAATQADDPEARFATLREAEAILLQDAPMLMLFQYVVVNLYDPAKVSGLNLNAWSATRLEQIQVSPQ